jgi:hypothetical protein
MQIRDFQLDIPIVSSDSSVLSQLSRAITSQLGQASVPIRFLVSATTATAYRCEIAVIDGCAPPTFPPPLFELRRRKAENIDWFNVVLVIPTGIGCSIGGHAGDANPVVKLLASMCDTLITHPNAVNASDLNELPDNALYVEGSILSRVLMGTAGLRRVRANRLLVVIEAHEDAAIRHAALNSVAAAQATYGLASPSIVLVDPSLTLSSHFTQAGRATGSVRHLDRLVETLQARRKEFDAVAISTRVQVDEACRIAYYQSHGEMVNPWGGVEALLTHAISTLLDVPAAHAPMVESMAVARQDLGMVDARMAAEAISTGFFMCVLKGLQRSPRIETDPARMMTAGVLTASDLSCLVVPDGCLGLPTLAALEQGIPVIAVRGNTNLMQNDLGALPWAPGQFHRVENYLEAAGMLAAIKGGIAPSTLVRPLPAMVVAPLPPQRKAKVSEIFAQRESTSLRRGADGADGLAEARPRG